MEDNESDRDKQQRVEEMSQSRKRASLAAILEKTEDRIKRLRCDTLDAELEKEHSHSTATMADNESNCDKQQRVEEMSQSRKQASLDSMLEKTETGSSASVISWMQNSRRNTVTAQQRWRTMKAIATNNSTSKKCCSLGSEQAWMQCLRKMQTGSSASVAISWMQNST
jgi:predicted DNA binding CopG/RHH family protein